MVKLLNFVSHIFDSTFFKGVMTGITFELELEDYLKDWFIYAHGGLEPVRLKKGSLESIIVQRFSKHKRDAVTIDKKSESSVSIFIPDNKAKPAEVYCFINDRTKKMIHDAVRMSFDLAISEGLVKNMFPPTLKKDMIYEWMEENGIETSEKNWFAVEKRYNRLRASMVARKKYREKKSE